VPLRSLAPSASATSTRSVRPPSTAPLPRVPLPRLDRVGVLGRLGLLGPLGRLGRLGLLGPLGLLGLLGVGALTAPVGLSAQTILNTERFQLQAVDGRHAKIDLSLSGREGNRSLWVADASGIVGTQQGKGWLRLIFGGNYLVSEDASLLDQRFAQLRFSYQFSGATQSFHFVQAQRNETLKLRQRWLVGSGAQRTFLSSEKGSVSLGTGLMMEWESLDPEAVAPGDPSEFRRLRIANLGVARYTFESGVAVLNVFYLQPSVRELDALRILNDFGVELPVSEWMRVTTTGSWRRDTRPPGTLARDDLNVRIAVGIQFRE
jgi:hypothetical protein